MVFGRQLELDERKTLILCEYNSAWDIFYIKQLIGLKKNLFILANNKDIPFIISCVGNRIGFTKCLPPDVISQQLVLSNTLLSWNKTDVIVLLYNVKTDKHIVQEAIVSGKFDRISYLSLFYPEDFCMPSYNIIEVSQFTECSKDNMKILDALSKSNFEFVISQKDKFTMYRPLDNLIIVFQIAVILVLLEAIMLGYLLTII